MKQIIEGHMYDTDLARMVANNYKWLEPDKSPTGGLCKVTETLYRELALKPGVSLSEARKKTSWGGFTWDDNKIDKGNGSFFLVISIGWDNYDSAAVHPLTKDQAKRWFERHHGDNVETYVELFGEPSTCLQGYQEETQRERELRERDNEITKLREELAEANGADEFRERDDEIKRLRDEIKNLRDELAVTTVTISPQNEGYATPEA